MKWLRYKWRQIQIETNTNGHKYKWAQIQMDTNTNGEYAKSTVRMHHIRTVHSAARVNIQLSFKQYSYLNITLQQYLITCYFPNQIRQFGCIKYCLFILWALLSFVLDHLFQNQQYWQRFYADNRRSNSTTGWCILRSHQWCPSYSGHYKCWYCR